MKRAACVVVVFLLSCLPLGADANLHVLTATMTSCGCALLPSKVGGQAEWWCFAIFTSTDPPEHFSAAQPAQIYAEIEGEALGQCGNLQGSLPRQVRMLFWLDELSIDFTRDIVHSPVKGYHLTGL